MNGHFEFSQGREFEQHCDFTSRYSNAENID